MASSRIAMEGQETENDARVDLAGGWLVADVARARCSLIKTTLFIEEATERILKDDQHCNRSSFLQPARSPDDASGQKYLSQTKDR